MYKNMSEDELIELFRRYLVSENWKHRVEAAKMISYIKNGQKIHEISDDILKLSEDNNLAVKLNLLTSLKTIITKYPVVTIDLLILIYLECHSTNRSISEFAKRIIDSLNPEIINRCVIDLTNKLYSRDPFERAHGLIGLASISLFTPDYLKNSLPEIVMISMKDEYELLELIAIEILEEFKNINAQVLRKLYSLVKRPSESNISDIFNTKNAEEMSKSVVFLYFKKSIKKEEIIELIKNIDHGDKLIKVMSILTIGRHCDILKEIYSESPEIVIELMDKVIKNLESDGWSLRAASIFLFKNFILELGPLIHIDRKYVKKLFDSITKNLNDNYIARAYALKVLYNIYISNQEFKNEVKNIVNRIDLAKIIREHHLCYYKGMPLILELKRYECLSPVHHPYLRKNVMEYFQNLDIFEHSKILRAANALIMSNDWLNRYKGAKELGNSLYSLPSYIKSNYELIKKLIKDSVYLVRNVGVWILRIIVHRGYKPPKNIIINTAHYCDDWYWEIRLEYGLLYYDLLKKYPEILEDKEIREKLLSVIATKYLTDRKSTIRKICKELLEYFPESKDLQSYFDEGIFERFEILENAIKNPILRKAAFIRLKKLLRKAINKNDTEKIENILNFLERNMYLEDVPYLKSFYILEELIILKEKNNELAKKLVQSIKEKYPKLPKVKEKVLKIALNELIVVMRIYGLRELLSYIKEGFIVSDEIIDIVKELAIYTTVNQRILDLSLKILEKVDDIESRAILKEKKELEEYLKNRSSDIKETDDINDPDWKNVYYSITYLSSKDLLDFNINPETRATDLAKFLESKQHIILNIVMMDIIIDKINHEDKHILKIIDEKRRFVFNTLLKLILFNEYHLMSTKALKLLMTIMIKREHWLIKSIIDGPDDIDYLPLIKKLFDYGNIYIQMETLDALQYLLKNREYKMDLDLAEKILGLIKKDERWIILRKVMGLLYECSHTCSVEVINKVAEGIITYLKNSTLDDDSKLYLIRYFKKDDIIQKVDKIILEELVELKNHENPYIKYEINNMLQKIKE